MADAAPEGRTKLDLVGTVLSALGLGLVVFGILRAGEWGFVAPKPAAPQWLGLSPTIWLVLGGGLALWLSSRGKHAASTRGKEPLVDPSILRNTQLRGGLVAFFFQFLLQSGLFFAVPLFLSVALGLSAIDDRRAAPARSRSRSCSRPPGSRSSFPHASPRRVVQAGFLALFAGIAVMVGALDAGAGPEIVTWPLLLAGLGIGALASQLGAVTVSAVPDEQSSEVGGLQNTGTNLGASIGTALAGAVLISALTSAFLTGITQNPDVPESVVEAHRSSSPVASPSSPTPSSRRRSRMPTSRRRRRPRSSTRTRRRGSTPSGSRSRSSPSSR